MDVVLELWDERPISVELPETDRSDDRRGRRGGEGADRLVRYKPAILDNGVRVMVPPHISSGTRIVVHVYDREYVRRAD